MVDKVFQNTVSAKQLAWTAWSYSDWLINYSAGFVRRGLGGEIMQAIWSPERFLANLNLYLFIQFLAFTLLFTGLFVRVSGLNRALLLALAMPGGVYNMAWTNEFFHRKEMLFNLFRSQSRVSFASRHRWWRGKPRGRQRFSFLYWPFLCCRWCTKASCS